MTEAAGSDIVSRLIDGFADDDVTSSSLLELFPLLDEFSGVDAGVESGEILALPAEVSEEADFLFLAAAVVSGARAETRAQVSTEPLILHDDDVYNKKKTIQIKIYTAQRSS